MKCIRRNIYYISRFLQVVRRTIQHGGGREIYIEINLHWNPTGDAKTDHSYQHAKSPLNFFYHSSDKKLRPRDLVTLENLSA